MTSRNQRGSAAIEAAIGVPAFGLLLTLIVFGGQTTITHQALQSAAADAARSASIARNPEAARTAAHQSAVNGITNQAIGCASVAVTVDTSDFGKQPGVPGSVEVTIACLLDLSDLILPGIPGTRVVRATMSSPLDTWRER